MWCFLSLRRVDIVAALRVKQPLFRDEPPNRVTVRESYRRDGICRKLRCIRPVPMTRAKSVAPSVEIPGGRMSGVPAASTNRRL
jgi:hypothetical protein